MTCVSIAAPGTTISTAATSASADIPKAASGKYPQFIRLAATAACYARLGVGRGGTGTAVMGLQSCEPSDAGTGYEVGDTITLAGGTSTTAAVLTVSSVDTGGEVLAVEVTTPGAYSVLPTAPIAQGSTSGAGTGATFGAELWQVVAVTVTGAGTGYQQGAAVSFSGGDGVGAAATLNVNSTTGAVTSVTVTDAGDDYTTIPTVSFGTAVTAVAGDTLIQPGDALVLRSAGSTTVAAIRVSGDGVLQISPVEDVFR